MPVSLRFLRAADPRLARVSTSERTNPAAVSFSQSAMASAALSKRIRQTSAVASGKPPAKMRGGNLAQGCRVSANLARFQK
jgi:hypothetical protein